MRRVVSSLVLAAAFAVLTSANASAGLFGGLLCKKSCDAGCAEPACGCEAPCEPACGIEAPACGCEAPACDSGCGIKKPGLLSKLFSKCKLGKHAACDSGCAEPACGVEAPCAPACEPACGVEPACGCEVPACDSGCGIKKPGFLAKLFSKKSCLGCEAPSCGCEAPTCGCEPSCGF